MQAVTRFDVKPALGRFVMAIKRKCGWLAWVGVCLLAIGLAGCGGGSNGETGATGATGATGPAGSQGPAGPGAAGLVDAATLTYVDLENRALAG